MSESIHIPQELVDIVVSNLHEDLPSLKACALVSHSFLPSSQKGIFACIEVFTVPPPSRSGHTFQNLLSLLLGSPHISPLITSLEIYVHDTIPGSVREQELAQIIPILPYMSSVKRFRLSHTCELFDWRYFIPHVQDALVQYWQTSQIVDFELEDICFIVFEGKRQLILDQWGTLKRLSLLWCHVYELWSPEGQGSIPLRLEALKIYAEPDNTEVFGDNLLNLSSRYLDLRSLREFSTVIMSNPRFDQVYALLCQVSNTLQHICLDIRIRVPASHFLSYFDYMDLHAFPNLHAIHLILDTPCDVFPISKLSPSVRDVTLEVIYHRDEYAQWATTEWSTIDSFMESQHLPALKSFRLEVHISTRNSCLPTFCLCNPHEVDLQAIRRAMPTLYGRGILDVVAKSTRTVWIKHWDYNEHRRVRVLSR
ncbi:hypothetical protein IW261DRAFT_1677838 [Armillaria novae-zelandiae]|uniref:Uncharacterized protein n=1 Tax=Armillaria novae-zelandiae TaxID=153914 RepID=A0AA39PDH1_9AGAR|nr:hypothetical protein IW261DRAFT_1677838 [Armillaria novae-zelandiae]